ncbi:MAG: DUF4876 domain-containing protein, partial [Muribaculum sp.]|nr:DUF4876 domain-containing protein [Muribaculum sp.]
CAAVLLFTVAFAACSDDNNPTVYYDVTVSQALPVDMPVGYSVTEGNIKWTENNTGSVYTTILPITEPIALPAGVYSVDGLMTVADSDGNTKTLRAVASSVVVSADASLELSWFFYSPNSTLVFKEISVTGSAKATGSGSLYDSFFTIYNNSDEEVILTGVAISESALINNTTNLYDVITPEHNRQVAFTAQTLYVIPSKPDGTPYTLTPGKSIKIVDQAQSFIDAGGIDNTDADFEWYDIVNTTNPNALDTDNPEVPNLDKWYSYSATKWIVNQQCNRSYALIRIPEEVTVESFLSDYAGYYEYLSPVNGKTMSNSKCVRIPNEWILDGVNLSNSEVFVHGWLADNIDFSYAQTSDVNTERYGRMAQRRVASVVNGRDILMDTDDSLADFIYVSYK